MINIRSIQHYMYCPRRFALMELEKSWAENHHIVKANILHERVHSGEHQYKTKNKIVLSSIKIYNDKLDLYGVTDCIEFCKSSNGIQIPNLDGKYIVKIIEYKPTQPKGIEIRESDAIQVFAQKKCVDYIWNCSSEGYIYYSNTRKRVKMPFELENEKYETMLNDLIAGMKHVYESNIVPQKAAKQKCNGCSLFDMCMPISKKFSVRQQITEDIK